MNSAEVKQRMGKALEVLHQDLSSLKTGRATPALVEQVRVEAYETNMPLVELATISVPEPSSLVIAPFDRTIIKNIERAISMHKDLQLNPVVDGTVIRLTIPPLTAERRQVLVKQLGQKLEGARIMIRQVRGDEMRKLKAAFEAKQISEDERFRQEQELQEITDNFNEQIEQIGEQKEKELVSI
jgi:ribosome recycling factor